MMHKLKGTVMLLNEKSLIAKVKITTQLSAAKVENGALQCD